MKFERDGCWLSQRAIEPCGECVALSPYEVIPFRQLEHQVVITRDAEVCQSDDFFA